MTERNSSGGREARNDSETSADEERTAAVNRRDVLKSVGAAGALSLVGAAGFSGNAAALTYSNPVYEPILADPSIIETGDGTYYAYGTEDDSSAWGCDGTEWVPIVRSYDLANWEYIGNAFDAKPDWKDAGNIWAPDINWFNDEYHLYYSYSEWGDPNPGIGVATSSSPEGPFYDHGKVFDSNEIGVDNSIDPDLYVQNGTPYLIWGSFHGIYGVELTGDGLDWVSGTKFHLAGDAYEAPYLEWHDGYFYLFVTTGSCCEGHSSTYEVEVGRSESLFGPYYNQDGIDLRDFNSYNAGTAPILSGDARWAGPGHNATIWDDTGTEWIVYHAYDKTKAEYECTDYPRRSLMIDPIDWSGGWPSINDGTPSIGSSGPLAEGTYEIESVHTGGVLDVADWGTSNGDNILNWNSHGGANQHWNATHLGDGLYTFQNVNSGLYISVEGGSTDDGANVWQWAWENNPDQKWWVQDLGSGEYRLIPSHSDKAMDVDGGSSSGIGDNVHQWSWNGGAWQRWRFNPV